MKYYINRKTNVLCIDENPYTSYLADRGYEEISKEEYDRISEEQAKKFEEENSDETEE